MKKIFNVSLHRSGTQSFDLFMKNSRVRSTHWPKGPSFEKMTDDKAELLTVDEVWEGLSTTLSRFDAFSDVPFSFTYQRAFERYPEAHFLMLLRDWNGWAASVRRHMADRSMGSLERLQYRSVLPAKHISIDQYSDEDLRYVYFKHIENVVDFMTRSKANFRIFHLTDSKLGRALAEFLELPPVAFPSTDFRRRLKAAEKAQIAVDTVS